MAELAPIAAKVIASAAEMDKGLKEAEAKLRAAGDKMSAASAEAGARIGKALGEKIASGLNLGNRLADAIRSGAGGLAGLAGKAESLFEKALGDPGRFIAENIIGGIGDALTRVPVVGGLLALPFEGVAAAAVAALDTYKAGATRVREMGAAARAAGADVAEFQVVVAALGGGFVTGENIERAAASFGRFNAALGKAAIEGPGAHNAFTRLGLDLDRLTAMDPALAFQEFAERVGALGNRFAQTSVIAEVFGRRMVSSVLPILAQGPGALERARGMLDAFGATIGANSVAAVKAADMARKQLDLLKQGFSNQVTIAVGALLGEFTERLPKLSELGITFKGLANVVVDVAEKIAQAGAAMWEGWTNPEVWMRFTVSLETFLRAAIERIKGEIQAALADIFGDVGKSFLGRRLGLDSVAETLQAKSKRALGRSGIGFDLGKSFWEDFTDELGKTNAGKLVSGVFDAVRGRVADLGRTARDNDPFAILSLSADKLKESLGDPLEKIEETALNLNRLLEARPNLPDLGGFGDSPAARARFGLDKFRTGDDLRQKLEDGRLERQGFALLQQLRSAYGTAAYQPVAALEAGSKEAYSALLHYRSNAGESIQEEIRNILKEMDRKEGEVARQGKEFNESLKLLLAKLNKGRIP